MIKTLNPYPNPAKTAEIMSRYRPIAPKPETCNSSGDGSSSLSQKIKQSPYLRNLWPQLQARPTRTRKRGRAPFTLPPSSLKRHKPHVLGFCPPYHVTPPPPPPTPPQFPLPPSSHALGVLNCTLDNNPTLTHTNPSLVTLPLLPCSPSSSSILTDPNLDLPTNPLEVIDLTTATKSHIPEEKDLLQQLQKPVSSPIVIAPQPIRPIGSSISVVCISEDSSLPSMPQTPKTPQEVEREVESESLPAVISDSNNRVRMANSAYKEMVGQPECPWLESMVLNGGDVSNNNNGGKNGSIQCSKRISGEVTLHLCDSSIPTSSNGFSCWVRMEWESQQKKSLVNAFCDVARLRCESRNYLFTWRFHTREASQSSCNA